MPTFRRDIQIVMLTMFAVVLFAGAALCPASAQTRYESVYNGHRIIYSRLQRFSPEPLFVVRFEGVVRANDWRSQTEHCANPTSTLADANESHDWRIFAD